MTAPAWTSARVREPWHLPFVVTVGLVTLLLLCFRGTAVAMVEIWIRSETFTHAFVVPPIVAWLIWRKRDELAPLQPRPAASALLPMAALAVLWWLGQLAQVAAAAQLALVGMLVISVPLVLGWRVARTLAFPLAFLFFAVPIGEFMTPTLMHWTAEALVGGLRMTGIPVYQEGQQLVIPSGRWAVVEACSGVRYLMATFMVGSLFAYLNYSSTRKRVVFVVVSLVLPVLANWVRAYIIVMLGHLSNNEIATGVDHVVYGWVFFGVVILSLFFIGARWADPEEQVTAAGTAAREATARAESAVPGWRPLALAALALLVAIWPTWVTHGSAGQTARTPVRLQLPSGQGSWQVAAMPLHAWEPSVPSATLREVRGYQSPHGNVGVHVAYYRGQGQGVKLVSSANGFVSAPPWHVLSEGVITVPVDGQSIAWRRATLTASEGGTSASNNQQRLTVWRLYWLGDHVTQSDVQAKLLQAWMAARGEPDDGAAVHVVSDLADDAAAGKVLAAFVSENFTMLRRTLAQARESR